MQYSRHFQQTTWKGDCEKMCVQHITVNQHDLLNGNLSCNSSFLSKSCWYIYICIYIYIYIYHIKREMYILLTFVNIWFPNCIIPIDIFACIILQLFMTNKLLETNSRNHTLELLWYNFKCHKWFYVCFIMFARVYFLATVNFPILQ